VNYLAFKDYQKPIPLFKRPSLIQKTDGIDMYDVMKLKTLPGITVINKLIEFDPKYKEDLTSLYMGTNQFEKHWH
jgi:hypothetical protein